MRIAVQLLGIALVVALLAGCEGSSDESTQTRTQPNSAAETSAAPVGASARTCDTYAVDAKGLRVTGISCDAGR